MNHFPVSTFNLQQEAERFQFVSDDRDGMYFLLLVDADQIAQGGPVSPMFVYGMHTAQERNALGAWLCERRRHWPSWAAMAQISPQLLDRHISEQLTAEPIVSGHVVRRADETDHTLVLEEIVWAPRGEGVRIAWQHTFSTARECGKAQAWLLSSWERLAEVSALARAEGADAVHAAFKSETRKRSPRNNVAVVAA